MSPEPDLRPDKRIDEYRLIEKLSSYSHVWHAFDEGAEREVVLKFVEEKDSANREGSVLSDIDHPNILKLLRKFEHEGVSVLVFEYVPGVRLDKAIREGVSRENSYRICMNICSALSEVHKYGLYHGDLSPFNVIWSMDKGKAYLIDFGAMGGCTVLSAAPEHDPDNEQSIGPHTDIVGLGRILMLMLPNMKSVYERCLYDDARLRPTAEQVYRVLKKARDKRKILLRTLMLAVVIAMVGLSSAFVVNENREPTRDEILLKLATQPTDENITALQSHLYDMNYSDYRDMIIRTLAQHNEKLEQNTVVVPDLDNYIAIFAFQEKPLVILDEGVLRLGDWATIRNEHGYILEINRGNVILKTTEGSKEIRYPKPVIFETRDLEYKTVNILPRPNNFAKILGVTAKANDYELDTLDFDGTLSGGFAVDNYEQFLKQLSPHIETQDHNILLTNKYIPRSVISTEPYWQINRNSLRDLLHKYEPYIGYKCEYLGNKDLSDWSFPIMQFHELIEALDLETEISDHTIFVRDGPLWKE